MLVDCHTHVWLAEEHLSEEFLHEAQRMRAEPIEIDCIPERHWQAMQGVDRAVVVAFEAGHLGLHVPNRFVADYVHQHPDKLIGFASVDPYAASPVVDLEHAIHDLGLSGLKLAPTYQGIDPRDERCMAVWSAAARMHLPVLVHQGATFPRRAPLKYAHPEQLEDVLLACPRLKLWIAHLGHPWYEETFVLMRKQPNVYADLSGLWYRPWQYYNALRLAQEYGVLDKIFFGSDFPIATPEETLAGTRSINDMLAGTRLPRIDETAIEAMLNRDPFEVLEMAHP